MKGLTWPQIGRTNANLSDNWQNECEFLPTIGKNKHESLPTIGRTKENLFRKLAEWMQIYPTIGRMKANLFRQLAEWTQIYPTIGRTNANLFRKLAERRQISSDNWQNERESLSKISRMTGNLCIKLAERECESLHIALPGNLQGSLGGGLLVPVWLTA